VLTVNNRFNESYMPVYNASSGAHEDALYPASLKKHMIEYCDRWIL
jgi:hypothetical protein